MTFQGLNLRPELVRAVEKRGYSAPTPIQAKAIPEILQGRDVMGGAQTGTGKTAAFTLPLLQNLTKSEGDFPAGTGRNKSQNKGRRPIRALILCPTRELAIQILESVEGYGSFLNIKAVALFGGVKINPQIDTLRRGVDVVVATPGRLLDHMGQGTIDLSGVEVLVLDEADRMLDMGFIRDIRKVLKVLPEKRQNMLFSATFSKEIKRLSKDILSDPALIEVNPQNSAADTVRQVVHKLEKSHKRYLLAHLIKEGNWYQVLVFSRTKHGAQRLARQLTRQGIESAAIHGDKSQGARVRALAEFKSGKLQALVATDIAARGLDIHQLSHVVNYDLPNAAEDYVHRIGRTGRAGEEGMAISFCAPEEEDRLKGIEKLLKRSLPVETVEGFVPPPPQEQGNQNTGAGGNDGPRKDFRGYKKELREKEKTREKERRNRQPQRQRGQQLGKPKQRDNRPAPSFEEAGKPSRSSQSSGRAKQAEGTRPSSSRSSGGAKSSGKGPATGGNRGNRKNGRTDGPKRNGGNKRKNEVVKVVFSEAPSDQPPKSGRTGNSSPNRQSNGRDSAPRRDSGERKPRVAPGKRSEYGSDSRPGSDRSRKTGQDNRRNGGGDRGKRNSYPKAPQTKQKPEESKKKGLLWFLKKNDEN